MKTKLLELTEFESMSKVEVRALADSLLEGKPDIVETCVRFVCAETVNLWHGRGRAMMCRRLKHIPLARNQKDRLVECILHRLATGQFSEQFRDQLRLALHLDRRATLAATTRGLESEKPHVKRYSKWVLPRAAIDNDAYKAAAGDAPQAARP
jgi:hypothetical protein